jgi:hypothetical protein
LRATEEENKEKMKIAEEKRRKKQNDSSVSHEIKGKDITYDHNGKVLPVNRVNVL